jgi:hypothetical protein
MDNSAPIELNFYNEEDEIIATYKRLRIPSYLLDMAIDLQAKLSEEGSGDQTYSDALFDFVVEFYGNKFTREDLKQKTDLLECMSVLRSVITRATALMQGFAQANPRVPSPKRK